MIKKNKWTYGIHKFKNKEQAVKFIKDSGHSKGCIKIISVFINT